jgi:hypothetical protein
MLTPLSPATTSHLAHFPQGEFGYWRALFFFKCANTEALVVSGPKGKDKQVDWVV